MQVKTTVKQNTQPIQPDSEVVQQEVTQEASETVATPAEVSEKPKAKAKANKYPEDWQDKVIVEQWKVAFLNGGLVEEPGTRSTQTYDPDFFEGMLDRNFFSESQYKYEIKHDPRKK